MLAQNFMSAAELQISDKGRNVLISVLGMLERNEIPHYGHLVDLEAPRGPRPTGFNMTTVFGQTECGTAACLLGWARFISGDDWLFRDACMTGDMWRLFFGGGTLPETTPAEAAIALRGYLRTGKVNWKEALNRAGTT